MAFAEWCLDQDGTTVFVNDLAEAPRNITLYGKWTREFLTVFFDTNGGESVVANKPVSYGKSFGTLPIPTRRNYTFLGWFTTSSEIGGVQITESSVPTSYEDITLYARWKRKSATLIFNANEGVVSDASKDVLCGDPYGVLPIPTRDGYRFEGWYTAKTGEEKITEATMCESEGNITVYAHWALKETITAPASSVPSDAEILNRWWTYTKTETKESTSATLSGWTRVGSYWKKIGSGSVTYASFPDGFDKTHSFYTSMQDISDEEVLANLPKNSETETTKREVETLWQAYIYWHWMYELAQPYGAGNRVICYVSQGVTVDGISRFPVFNAFISATAYDPIQSGGHGQTGVYQWYIVTTPPSGVDHNGTKYWYRFSYYIRNYTDYQKIYQFERVTTDLKSSVAVTPGDGISNVQEMVEYRPK